MFTAGICMTYIENQKLVFSKFVRAPNSTRNLFYILLKGELFFPDMKGREQVTPLEVFS